MYVTPRKRTIETRDQLTAQEGQGARLARDGLSNPDESVLISDDVPRQS